MRAFEAGRLSAAFVLSACSAFALGDAVGTIKAREYALQAAASDDPLVIYRRLVHQRAVQRTDVPDDLAQSAVKRLLQLAEGGDCFAQNAVAVLTEFGNVLAKDLSASAQWYRRAAEQV